MTDPGRTTRRIAAIISGTSRISPEQIVASLTRHSGDMDLEIRVASSSSEATLAANQAARTAEIVIAVGGDGTVSDVATGIFGSSAALGIVPAGSTNIAARSLGIPAATGGRSRSTWRAHRLRAIDIGRSEDRSFVHIAGAGFDAELFKGASPVWKRRLGWFAYLPAAVAALRLPPSDVRITADGAVLEARSPLVLIANGGSAIAPQFRIYPGITVDDGWLDVLIFTSSTPAQIASDTRLCGDAATRSISPRPAPPRAHRGDRGSASPSRGARRRPAWNHAPAVPHRSSGTARRHAAPSA